MMRQIAVSAAVAVLFVLAGCGGDDESSNTGSAEAQACRDQLNAQLDATLDRIEAAASAGDAEALQEATAGVTDTEEPEACKDLSSEIQEEIAREAQTDFSDQLLERVTELSDSVGGGDIELDPDSLPGIGDPQ